MFKTIVLIPTQGFGNRIKAITSGKILAEYYNVDLYINWEKEDCINIDYNDIFSDDPKRYDLSKLKDVAYIYNPNIHTEKILIELEKNTLAKFDVLVIQGGHVFKHPRMSVEDYLIRKSETMKSLKFNDYLIQKKNKLIENSTYLIGIHIRTLKEKYDRADANNNDHFKSFESPIDYYFSIIDRVLENTNKFKPILYISTNDNMIKNKLIDKYTNTITQEKIEYERNQKDAILNSLIDFLVLSSCQFILGTHYSSFSDEACFMNLICKYCMSSHPPSLGYHTYGYDQKLNMILPNPLVKKYLKFIE